MLSDNVNSNYTPTMFPIGILHLFLDVLTILSIDHRPHESQRQALLV